ncbi:MAG: FAD:protein FMN transferase [Kiritimatiellae bacterium]|nr:FAD:protein FMN transferase [Kiritimatiellia bacterium]MDW8457744.1 FAD:protein FMN transferase [Verrucomicrobiota bacterium]
MKLIQPRRFEPLKALWVLAVLVALFVYTTRRDRPPQLWRMSGEIFGSTYRVQIVDRRLNEREAAALHGEIQRRLDEIDAELSTWKTNSALSRFNADPSLAPIEVTPRIAELAALSLEISRASGGAFDVTFAPLFDAWGFGRTGPKRVPDPDTEAAARESCGYHLLTVLSSNHLQKAKPGVQIVFNAIAPGHAAQEISDWLASRGFTNTFVEIGGEIVVRGVNLAGRPWRIGIERPVPGSEPGKDLAAVLEVTDAAVATSGDYRNFLLGEDGQSYSHLFDPRIGRPAKGRVASVTVVASNGALADALATTMFVMGPEEGIPWLREHSEAEALFFVRQGATGLTEVASPGFAARAGYRSAPTPAE